MTQRQAIFILGGGSGTSALTRLLSLSGCALPGSLLGADDFNPRGYWEPTEALKLNDEFLLKHGSTFFDPTLRLQEEASVDAGIEAEFLDGLGEFLRSCPDDGRPVLIKEPRITPLFKWWKRAAQREGIAVKVVNATRHPTEVAAALASVLRASVELSNAIWLKYNLLAERLSRDVPRVFVSYANVLEDWRGQVIRVSNALSVDLTPDNPEVEGFITRDLYRKRHSGPPVEVFGQPWLARAHSLFVAAGQDEPVDLADFDALYDAYRVTERAFRVALNDSRAKFKPDMIRAMNQKLPRWTAGREY